MSLIECVLSDEHREFRDRAAAFADDVVAPRADEIESTDEFPRDVIDRAGDAGLIGILLPEEYGGEGSDFLSYCLAIEQIARASGAVAESIQGHTFAALPIAKEGSEDQREKYLEPMARGEKIGSMLLTEPGAGSSPTELASTATLVKADSDQHGERDSNHYRLTGEKSFGTNAGVADVNLVVARKVPTPQEGHGVSVFLVDDPKKDMGFCFERREFMGMRGHITGDSTFDDLIIPESALLGEVGQGFRLAMD
ncbi:MAG: acyl-CoA dehydrogenase family protein, partial [Natronomonas sp.]|uniref:acyl-CoA dehydrogenase family protein n=1 Tax=Natronomonas sp. TaxID=2184060 RepID=UPI00287026A2